MHEFSQVTHGSRWRMRGVRLCSRSTGFCFLFARASRLGTSASSCVCGCESMLGTAVLDCSMVLRRRMHTVASFCFRLFCVMQTAVGCWFSAFLQGLSLSRSFLASISLRVTSRHSRKYQPSNEQILVRAFRSWAGASPRPYFGAAFCLGRLFS